MARFHGKSATQIDFYQRGAPGCFYHQYTGECSYYGANLIKDQVEAHHIDFIIGVGGGKLTDLVGYAAHLTNTPFGVVPTLASNCAPWTPLAVMYKETANLKECQSTSCGKQLFDYRSDTSD